MVLDGSQLEQLHKAFLSAFPTKGELERLIAFRFKTYLNQIVGGENLEDIVFHLIQWAEAQGFLRDLVIAARESNPGNPDLNAIAETLLGPQTRNERKWQAYRKKYLQHLFFEHRHFDIKGLSARGQYNLALQQVFVELSMVSEMPGREARNPIAPVPTGLQTGQHPIWEFLHCPPGEASNLAIIGSPGSGKTTLLKHMALMMYAGEDYCKAHNVPYKLPILLFLRDHAHNIHADKRYSLVQAVRDNLDKFEGPEPPLDGFETALESGDCLILLDGLDEVADAELRKKVVAWVEKQLVKHGNNSFVITSRPHGYENNPLERVNLLRVRHFNQEQQRQFVQNWCLATEVMANGGQKDEGVERDARRKAKDLLTRLQNNTALSELAVNPLLLTLITQVHYYRNSLPGRRVELYQEVCNVFLGKRREAFDIVDDITPIQKQLILQPLAYEMMRRSIREISTDAAIKIIAEPLRKVSLDADPATFLKAIENSSGLLLERENNEFAFAHLTFQEFLASVHIEAQRLEDELKIQVKNGWWHETIRLYCARSKDATLILQACLDTEDIDALALTTECVDDGCLAEPELRSRIDSLVTTQVDSANEKERRIAAEILLRRRLRGMTRINENKYVDNHMISHAEYQLFLDECYQQRKYYQPDHWSNNTFPPGKGLIPIVGVRSSDAIAFCAWLTERERNGWHYRLPGPDDIDVKDALHNESNAFYWTVTKEGNIYCSCGSSHIPILSREKLRNYRENDLGRDRIQDLARARTLTSKLVLARDLDLIRSYDLDLDLARSMARELDLDLTLARSLDLDLTRNYTLSLARSLARSHARDVDVARVRALDHSLVRAFDRSLAHDLALALAIEHNRTNKASLNLTELHSIFRWHARIQVLGFGQLWLPKEWTDIYIALVILEERIEGNLPAFEGIRIVKERVQTSDNKRTLKGL